MSQILDTAAELDALPAWALIRQRGTGTWAIQKVPDGQEGWPPGWYYVGVDDVFTSTEIVSTGPGFYVLYLGAG